MAARHRRARLHPTQLCAVHGRRKLSGRGDRAHSRPLEAAVVDVPPGARARRLRRRCHHAGVDHSSRTRLHRPAERNYRRLANGCPAQAGHHALRRLAHGRDEPRNLRVPGLARAGNHLHEVSQDAQRRCLRRVSARRQTGQAQPPHHGTARCLRSRPHHRRLPPRRAVRRDRPDRGEENRTRRTRPASEHRRRDSFPRGERRAGTRPERTHSDGRVLRLRHHSARRERDRSGAVALLRLPRRGQGTKRCRHVVRPQQRLSRRLPRTRPGGGNPDRKPGAGTHRRPRDQAAYRAFSAHPRI